MEFPGLSSLRGHLPFSKTELRQETVGVGGQLNRTHPQPWGATVISTLIQAQSGLPSHKEDGAPWGTDQQPRVGEGLGQDLAPAWLGSAFPLVALPSGKVLLGVHLRLFAVPSCHLVELHPWGLSPGLEHLL